MKIAFVHDWFNANGGAEKVAGEIMDIYKDDEVIVYTLFDKFAEADKAAILKDNEVKTSLMQHAPFVSRYYRYFLPFMPWLMSRFYLKGYDVIISTSHAVAKGFRSDPSIPNICYCHTPLRPIWDMYDDYAAGHAMGRSSFYRRFVQYLRKWDLKTAANVNYFVANSIHIQQRIEKSYGRTSTVIYPPVRVDKFELSEAPRKDYYLCLGRFVPYKKTDMVIRAFGEMPDKKLVLIGDGWGTQQFNDMLRQYPNVEWLGYKKDREMISCIQEAKACIFAAKEDFGIMCVEVQACGTPVLALDYGGYKETVADGVSGYLFPEQTEQGVIDVVRKFEHQPLTDHKQIRANSLRFSAERFRSEFSAFVKKSMQEFYKGKHG
jgi:glycosyltransferase involved in cell wall biosynthesis